MPKKRTLKMLLVVVPKENRPRRLPEYDQASLYGPYRTNKHRVATAQNLAGLGICFTFEIEVKPSKTAGPVVQVGPVRGVQS